MSTSTPSLSRLDEDIIFRVLHFAPYIWEVLNFTATCQRFHSVAEDHLRSLEYLDIRLLYRLDSPEAEAINDGIKTLITQRIGGQLAEVKILNAGFWMSQIDFVSRLNLVPDRVKQLMQEKPSSALSKLVREVACNRTTIRMQQRVRLETCQGVMEEALNILKTDKDAFRDIVEGLSTVTTLEAKIQDVGKPGDILRADWLFPCLETIRLKLPGSEGSYFHYSSSGLKDLIEHMSPQLKYQVRDLDLLESPEFAVDLCDYLSRLAVDCETRIGTYPSPYLVSHYKALEDALRACGGEDTEAFLSAICRRRVIARKYLNMEELRGLICFRPNNLERLYLHLLYNHDDESVAELFQCIIDNCPNVTHLELSCHRVSYDTIVNLIDGIGFSLEQIVFKYEGDFCPSIITAIVNHCPNLKCLILKGFAHHIEYLKPFYPSFRQMPNLDVVSFSSDASFSGHHYANLVYCNDKMSLLEGSGVYEYLGDTESESD
ncbi:hypothetical protein HDE_07584 [Halotydeus destructor]|nr:hypothetical protein HDE_07584 [Halotydeus destructor]